MKYGFCLLIIAVTVSCSPFLFNTEGYERMDENLYAAWSKTSSYKYIAEGKGNQYWKSPKEFEVDGGGDCEDFSGYLMYQLGEGDAVIVTYQRDGKSICHCIIRYRGKYLEPQIFDHWIEPELIGWKIVETYSWTEYMAKITDFGTRDL